MKKFQVQERSLGDGRLADDWESCQIFTFDTREEAERSARKRAKKGRLVRVLEVDEPRPTGPTD